MDQHGLNSNHVLHVAIEAFRVNGATNSITCKQSEDGNLMREAIDRDMELMQGDCAKEGVSHDQSTG
ncbi:hypothetical protein HPB48_021338 [Haemaphysalis longicornis]|uniref:Uncharacterized protein n=1 Tax=Haemaphysalis longicornis TaxID=44386 RepID=A0A9J6GQL6_HAELO|nr:hypothetical protein HPB48_021338 [Haemaphysalis longicornis]